jgi:proteasome lid subunit RPN8/RPN11
MGMEIEVTRAVMASLAVEAIRAHPIECCGLLLGRTLIEQLQPVRNIHPDPESGFEIDPKALIAAHKAERSSGPRLIGYYHSHPSGPAEPSAIDRARASGDNRVWAIIGRREITFWKDMFEGFVPLSLRVVAG